MSIIYVLIPLAVVIILVAIGVFFWAVKSDQFNDLDRQGYSILFDDDTRQTRNREASIPPGSSPEHSQDLASSTKPTTRS